MEPELRESEILADDDAPIGGVVSWHAPEFEYHSKKAGWYLLFFLIFAILVGAAVFTKQWFTIAVFGVMALALVLWTNRRPRDLNYQLDDRGVTIDAKFYPYGQFESFSIIEDRDFSSIELDPIRRFAPRVTLPLEDGHEEEVARAIADYLPHVERDSDLIDRVTRRLKF